jgi:preprotein translocase subunit Sss1
MNLLSDEILNKYLDSELSAQDLAEVDDILKKSEADRKRFNALKLIHKELLLIKEDKVSDDFTELVMTRVRKKFVLPKQQNYFIISIASILVLICLGIVTYIISAIVSSSPVQTESLQITETVNHLGNGIVIELKKLFSGKNLSIVGSVFSLAILISGYFFFEQQKRSKINLGA